MSEAATAAPAPAALASSFTAAVLAMAGATPPRPPPLPLPPLLSPAVPLPLPTPPLSAITATEAAADWSCGAALRLPPVDAGPPPPSPPTKPALLLTSAASPSVSSIAACVTCRSAASPAASMSSSPPMPGIHSQICAPSSARHQRWYPASKTTTRCSICDSTAAKGVRGPACSEAPARSDTARGVRGARRSVSRRGAANMLNPAASLAATLPALPAAAAPLLGSLMPKRSERPALSPPVLPLALTPTALG
mmetsp:Transcript_14173/g.34329  ORF Transcript_14173/g.34329 Transcript_14173/m.34329 type:complete len:251 (+) Transcript_14173:1132-1884(+)